MKNRLLILVAIGLGILGLCLLWPLFENPVDLGRGEHAAANSGGNLRSGVGLLGEAEGNGDPQRENRRVAVPEEAAATPSDPKPGALVVRARWQDGKPAPDVAVALHTLLPIGHTLVQRPTNEQGMVRFENLVPGVYWATSDRGGRAKTTVEAGKVAEAVLELKGVDVQGVVVDGAGAAVADAGIWLTRAFRRDWQGGRVVARSNESGEFRIRGVPPGQSLGALARGFAPSDLVDLDVLDTAKAPVQVRLVVASRGGAVSGTVRLPDGEPAAGADVCVGSLPEHFRPRHGSNRYIEAWTPLATSTNREGHFELPAVAPGKHPVAVRSGGLPIWKGEVVVEVGATAHLDVQLVEGVVVSGVVRDGAGKPIAGAVVRAYDRALNETFIQSGQFDYRSVFGFRFTGADTTGRYRLSGVAPGSIHLYATGPGGRVFGETKIRAKTVLMGRAGEELSWDPIIDTGHSISGQVTYLDGVPMKQCFVSIEDEKTKKRQSLTTNAMGRFLFSNLEVAHYKVSVQYPWREAPTGTPPLEKTGIWPDMGELRLVAVFDSPNRGLRAQGQVRGRIHDAAGRRLHAGPLAVHLRSDKGWLLTERADKDGAFEFKKVRPGRFRLVFRSGEDVIHATDWFQLMPAQKLQVGTLVTEAGGSLRIRIRRGKGMAKIEPRIWGKHLKTGAYWEAQPGLAAEHLKNNLCVGRHTIRASARGLSERRWDAEVKVGRETVVEVHLLPGHTRTLEVRLPVGHKPGRLDVTILDADGKVCLRTNREVAAGLPNPYRRRLYLPLGRYKVQVRTSAGLAGEQLFDVLGRAADAEPIRLTPKVVKSK